VICLLPTEWKWFLRNISLNECRNCEGEVSHRGHMITNLFNPGKMFIFSTLVLDPEFNLCTSVGSFVHIVGVTLMFRRIWSEQVIRSCWWNVCEGFMFFITCYIVMLTCNLLLVTSVVLCNTTLCVFSLSGSGRLTCLVTLMLGMVITGRMQGVKHSSADWELLLSLLLMPEIFSHHSFI